MVPQPAQRGGSAKSSAERAHVLTMAPNLSIHFLSRGAAHRTSAPVPQLFDMDLRALRRDRAARCGPALFLFERVFEDCLERIALMNRRFGRALLIGCPDPGWPERIGAVAGHADVRDPGPRFTASAGGALITEDAWEPPAGACDLVLAIGTLDTVNDLPIALRLIGYAMKPGAALIGAVSGGDTLPGLRGAMRAADALSGAAAPHIHPRIEASALSPLLTDAGFVRPVVDVERVQVSYPSLDRLVADLRAMGAINILCAKPPSLTRAQHRAASRAFAEAGHEGRTTETFEVLHFAAWTPEGG
jgi:NADH dehydrogenase [ubiquinone] 1 alpha subcomplex assembly factor 5